MTRPEGAIAGTGSTGMSRQDCISPPSHTFPYLSNLQGITQNNIDHTFTVDQIFALLR